jgi:Fur family transcriptional regulator, zinc uptake regulator
MRRQAARESKTHDHKQCIRRAVARAEQICGQKQVSLTPLRRRILEIVWRAHEPIGAYEILAELGKDRDKVGPPTVYRALEFLQQVGLVHRLDSLSAFLGCERPDTEHAGEFLVCSRCRRVTEIEDSVLSRVLEERARSLGYKLDAYAVEIKALCNECGAAR